MHSMYLAGVPTALVHVAATDPLCAGRHPDLVATAIVADRGAHGVGSVEEVIARHGRVVAARVAAAVVDGVMPVVVVIGGDSIPAAVVRLERVMRPANAGIGACDDNSLAGESERPDIRRVRVSDSRFDRRRSARLQRRFNSRAWLRKEF